MRCFIENITMNNGQIIDVDLISKTTYGLESDECSKEENEFWENEYNYYGFIKKYKN